MRAFIVVQRVILRCVEIAGFPKLRAFSVRASACPLATPSPEPIGHQMVAITSQRLLVSIASPLRHENPSTYLPKVPCALEKSERTSAAISTKV